MIPDKDWWRGAVIYQIYPRSYQDSDGDGVGDLRGIVRRLEHIARLGADAIWISPFFRSPMLDFGYDVSDYRDVDPLFGTLADFDAVLAEAHRLDLKVMIDLVLSHTSEAHPWFGESRESQDNPRSDWYVWGDAKPDGTPPNNWLSIFGGSAWEWSTERQQYYLHNFLTAQPDLNFHNPAVQDEMLDIARFWLDRGVDGFRLDTINFYFHDAELRDNPPLAPELRSASVAPAVNPYNWQDHIHDKNRPENPAFLRRLRAVLDEYPAAAVVGEVGDGQYGLELQADYTSGTDKVQMCYDFTFLSSDPPSGTRFAEVMDAVAAANPEGWTAWAYSNHDVPRHATRWGLDEAGCRAYAALLLSLRGSVCLYQGEEMGLPEVDIAYEDIQDPYGLRFWPKFKGRDGCRTPMPWQTDNASGGFSEGKPWLPVPSEHLSRAVAAQEADEGSLLHFYRRMLAFRAEHPALAKGGMEIVARGDDRLAFIREHAGARIFCAFNLGAGEQTISLPPGTWTARDDAPFVGATIGQGGVTLPPWQAFFATETGTQSGDRDHG